MFVAFVFGCAASLMTSGRMAVRLVGPATVYWTCVPLFEILGLAAVWRRKRSPVSFSRAVDLFLVGHGPWLLWLVAFAAMWAFISPIEVFEWRRTSWLWYSSALAVALWSGYIDFRFFRRVLARSPAGAGRDLMLQRAISWIGLAAWFVGPAAWSEALSRLGLT